MNSKSSCLARLHLGRIVVTTSALAELTPDDILRGIQRHVTGDWGDLDAKDCQANDEALVNGLRLLSAYRASHGTKFWIITEADRSVTTILLPEDC